MSEHTLSTLRSAPFDLLLVRDGGPALFNFVNLLEPIFPQARFCTLGSSQEAFSLLQAGLYTPPLLAYEAQAPGEQDLEFLALVRSQFPQIKLLCCAPFALDSRNSGTLEHRGILFIGGASCDPRTFLENVAAFLSCKEAPPSIKGQLEELPPIHPMRLAQRGQKTCQVSFVRGLCEGSLWFHLGILVRAELRDPVVSSVGLHSCLSWRERRGPEALFDLLAWNRGDFQISLQPRPLSEADFNIDDSLDALVEEFHARESRPLLEPLALPLALRAESPPHVPRSAFDTSVELSSVPGDWELGYEELDFSPLEPHHRERESLSLILPEFPDSRLHFRELSGWLRRFPEIESAIALDRRGFVEDSSEPEAMHLSKEAVELSRCVEAIGLLLGLGRAQSFAVFGEESSRVFVEREATRLYIKLDGKLSRRLFGAMAAHWP